MKFPWGYLKRFLAGAIFGLYMGHLLYILNPQIEITPARLAIVTVAYGLICGVLFGSLLWLLRLARVRLMGRPDEGGQRRRGLGLVVTAAFVSAAVFWMHLYLFRIYLPIGAVRILSIGTNVIAGTAFALLFLWLVERNAGTRTSRAIFFIALSVVALSSFFLYQRRDRYRTDERQPVVANVGTIGEQRSVIVVAVRGLPYDWVISAIADGSLPFMEDLLQHGYAARVEPFPTTSAKALWASLATGQLPHRHGVTGRFSYHTALNRPDERFLILPTGVGFRAWGLIPPVERISAQLPAGDSVPFWQMFERLELPTLVVNWPATSASRGTASVLIPDAVVRAIARRPSTLAAAEVTSRFPTLNRSQRERVGRALQEDATAFAMFESRRRARPFALSVVSLNGLADSESALDVGNGWPRQGSNAAQVVRAHLEAIDGLLARLRAESPKATIVIVSPSGADPPTLPGDFLSIISFLQASRDPGADDGVLGIAGPDVVHEENPPAAHIEDVVPTVLFAASIPVARDMDGRVLTEAFGESFLRENSLSVIQTYRARRLIVRRAGAS